LLFLLIAQGFIKFLVTGMYNTSFTMAEIYCAKGCLGVREIKREIQMYFRTVKINLRYQLNILNTKFFKTFNTLEIIVSISFLKS